MARGEDAKGDIKGRMNLLLQERERQRRLAQLHRDTLRKVEFLCKKAVIEHQEVYQLIREFFKEFLEKRYEFTINELRQELKKVYISNTTRPLIANVLDTLEAIEYTTVHYKREDLVRILQSFKEVVEQLVRVHTAGKSIIERIRSFLFKEPDAQTIIAELPVVEDGDAYRVRIYTLVEKCYIAMDNHNMHRAKTAYHVLLSEYETLPEQAKTQHYPIVQQTYQDILNRAKMIKE